MRIIIQTKDGELYRDYTDEFENTDWNEVVRSMMETLTQSTEKKF